jgi:hypothetical protein
MKIIFMNNFIDLTTAQAMTSLYRAQRNNILKPEFQDQNILCLSETFEKTAIQTLLNLTGCSFIRVYYGMSEDYKVHAIIVAADENNEDILPTSPSSMVSATTEEEMIVENGARCPDLCPPESSLNG